MKTAEEFVSLRTSDDPADYYRAAHEDASDDVWMDVILKYPDMTKWVAHNKTISAFIMEKLIDSDDVNVRLMLAMKRSCPPHLLQRLAADKHEAVRNAVALNRKTPPDILRMLADDEWETCASNAAARLAGRNDGSE